MRCFILRFIHSHSDATGVFSSSLLGKCRVENFRQACLQLDTLYPLKMTPLSGYWEVDSGRPSLLRDVIHACLQNPCPKARRT